MMRVGGFIYERYNNKNPIKTHGINVDIDIIRIIYNCFYPDFNTNFYHIYIKFIKEGN